MKTMRALVAVAVLVGCASSQSYRTGDRQPMAQTQTRQVAGLVPVDFENAQRNNLPVHVLIFEGTASVELVPDGRTGGWMYNRPAFAEFEMKPSLDYNWRAYVRVMLPRNSEFTVVARAQNFWGEGQPETMRFRTGSDPFSRSYTSVTPTPHRMICGAFVSVHPESIGMGDRMKIHITLDTRQWGAAITESIINLFDGR